VPSGEGEALLALTGAARGGRFVLAAVGARLAGEPYGRIVFLAVFLGGGGLLGWVDAAPR
jgi:hypothetical protein